MTKEALRRLYLEKRKKLTPAECSHFNLQLYNHFFSSMELSFIKVVHVFLSLEKNNEPDTWMIIDRIKREFPSIRISIPKMNAGGTLEHIYFEGLHQLETNTVGIQEPKHGVPTPIEKIDLVLVPLLVVDQAGNRVGYGKGFYDRFLAQCRKDCRKVGLSFFEAVDKIDDVDSFDVLLDSCVTPTQVLKFS